MLAQQRVDYEKGLRDFVEKAFRTKMPALINFSLQNQTVAKLLKHLRRHTVTSGSPATAYQYTYGVWRFHLWAGNQPDKILSECLGPDGEPLPKMLVKHAQLIDDFVGHLQESEQQLSPGTIANYAKGAKALYRANGLTLDLPRYPRTPQNPNRSLTPEELQRVLSAADSHEKLIVLLFVEGGFRETSLCQLKVGHLREDLEREVLPVHVSVPPEITKGKGFGMPGYWTFLGKEAIESLKTNLEERRRGNRWFEPEEITDNSPLIRNRAFATEVRPITPGAVWHTINRLYLRAGVIKQCPNQRDHRDRTRCQKCGWPKRFQKRHSLNVHSLRWTFITTATNSGVAPHLANYMAGHKPELYNDIQSRGVEFLRQKYASVDFGIIPKPKLTDRQIIEAFIRGRGLDPQQILRQEALSEAFSEPHRIFVPQQEREQWELRTLTTAFAHTFFNDGIQLASSAHSNLPRATTTQA